LTPGSTGLLYDFLYREQHATQGRWISPDPAGIDAADPTNPRSWNRYAYVLNNPLSTIDPLEVWTLPPTSGSATAYMRVTQSPRLQPAQGERLS
jgi:RHS repeat-associated protein